MVQDRNVGGKGGSNITPLSRFWDSSGVKSFGQLIMFEEIADDCSVTEIARIEEKSALILKRKKSGRFESKGRGVEYHDQEEIRIAKLTRRSWRGKGHTRQLYREVQQASPS